MKRTHLLYNATWLSSWFCTASGPEEKPGLEHVPNDLRRTKPPDLRDIVWTKRKASYVARIDSLRCMGEKYTVLRNYLNPRAPRALKNQVLSTPSFCGMNDFVFHRFLVPLKSHPRPTLRSAFRTLTRRIYLDWWTGNEWHMTEDKKWGALWKERSLFEEQGTIRPRLNGFSPSLPTSSWKMRK